LQPAGTSAGGSGSSVVLPVLSVLPGASVPAVVGAVVVGSSPVVAASPVVEASSVVAAGSPPQPTIAARVRAASRGLAPLRRERFGTLGLCGADIFSPIS
jgi:hypothetical protein